MNKINNLLDESNIISYEKYFEKTKQLINHFKDEDLQIKDNIRIFRSLKTGAGYEEIFINELQKDFGGMSNQISFLFPPGNRAFQNRLGFRFYKFNPLEKNELPPYFTLVNTGNRKFQILEKDSSIKDADGKTYILEHLDCLDIILTIIKNKTDENKLVYPNTIAEILGFIYAVKNSKYK